MRTDVKYIYRFAAMVLINMIYTTFIGLKALYLLNIQQLINYIIVNSPSYLNTMMC